MTVTKLPESGPPAISWNIGRNLKNVSPSSVAIKDTVDIGGQRNNCCEPNANQPRIVAPKQPPTLLALRREYGKKTIDLLIKMGITDPQEISGLLSSIPSYSPKDFSLALKALKDAGITDPKIIAKLLPQIAKFAQGWTGNVFRNLGRIIKICQERGLDITDLTQAQAEIIFGINPERFSSKGYQEIISNRLALLQNPAYRDERPLALILYPESDWNTAFENLDSIIDELIDRGFRVVYFEISSDQSFINSFLEATSMQKASLVVIGGHGTQTSTELSDLTEEELGNLDFSDEKQLAELSSRITDDAQIISISCSTGSGRATTRENMANMWSRVFPYRQIFAPTVSVSGPQLRWDSSGKRIKEVAWIYNGVRSSRLGYVARSAHGFMAKEGNAQDMENRIKELI